MLFLKWIATFLQKALRKAATVIVLAGYDHNSIYKYFRKKGAKIGEGCVISTKSLGTEPYLVSLGNHVWISRDVIFHTHDGGVWVLRDQYPNLDVYGPIIIEDNCIIGTRAQLLPNIRIGRNSVVGAGSVVISDVPPYSIVMGVPARPISSFSKYEEKCLAQDKVQKPPDADATKIPWDQSREAKNKKRRRLMELFQNQAKQEDGDVEK
jgi:acetyltransferase-like isoleucine patch superfamily enzyme